MKTPLFILLVLLITLVAGQDQPIRRFVASFSASEVQNGLSRDFHGRLFYADDWNSNTGSGSQAIRYDIDLNDGVISTTLTQLEIYQDQFFRYTICRTCSWQDLFAETPLPKLYVTGETPTQTNVNINGISTNLYTFNQNNVIGQTFNGYVQLYVKTSQPRWPIRAIITANGITKTIDMASHSTSVSDNVFDVPAGCPIIDPGCFRLDLAFVVDVSGSVGNNVVQERQFVIDMINTFLIGPKYLAASLTTFSTCSTANIRVPMSYNKATLLASIPNFNSDGWTCIVGGIQRGFWTFATVNGSRPATGKAMIVLTDGNGNRPCSNTGVLANPSSECGTLSTTALPCIPSGCNGRNPCDGNGCCQNAHDCHLTAFYNSQYNLYKPRIYAVGVTNAISDQTLRNIVNDPAALARGEFRIFRVDNFSDLNRIISALAAAIICNVPGSESCPNDCRPGGFCCGGSCQCTIDCSTRSTECQISVCRADANGADCALGPPDDAACQDPRIQCQDRFCQEGVGCAGTPNDALSCTDNNACTIDICLGGICTTDKNDSVFQCDDHNQCTTDDACLPDGACQGTPDDQLPCSDGNICTTDVCFNGTCISTPISCPDDTITDCRIPKCNTTTGVCSDTFIAPGFQCLPADPKDDCTVYVCSDYDVDAARNCNPSTQTCDYGRCVARTRDDTDCKGSDDNTAAIIGGVVGGVALLCIILVIAIILLLILCRKAVVGVVGNLNPFGASTNIKEAPTYVSPMDTGSSNLYEGS